MFILRKKTNSEITNNLLSFLSNSQINLNFYAIHRFDILNGDTKIKLCKLSSG